MANRGLMKLMLAGCLVLGGVLVGASFQHLLAPGETAANPAASEVDGSDSTGVLPASLGEPKEPSRVSRIYEEVNSSIVTVGAVKRQFVAQPWVRDFFAPSIRILERQQRLPYLGSGFLVDDRGHVVTNFHVIEDSVEIFVTFPDGREFEAKLVDADRFVDVALLQIDADGRDLPKPLRFADSEYIRIGEQVIALGNPFGNLIEDSRPTVTVGHVSALQRTFRPDQRQQRVYPDMIQTDAAINPGNSGGPLVDINGEVVGMNTFIVSPTGASAGVGFAIPSNRIRNFVQEIITHGRLRPLLLDFDFQSVRSAEGRAIRVLEVAPGGPAEDAGLRAGDVILEADGRPVESRENFLLVLRGKQVGDTIRLTVWRGGDVLSKDYKVLEAPAMT